MIIQCEKCQTRFRLDDSKVKDSGVKVRCTKCKHVFMVSNEVPEPLSVETVEGTIGDSATMAGNDFFNETTVNQSAVAEDTFSADTAGTLNFGEVSFSSESASPSASETDSFDPSAITLDSGAMASSEAEAASDNDIDFSEFHFGDSTADSSATAIADSPADGVMKQGALTPGAGKGDLQGLDFYDDDMFGSLVPSQPETGVDAISFDFGVDSFSDAIDATKHDPANKGRAPLTLGTASDMPFSLGEIDFGDELSSVAVQQVNPDDLKASQKELFAPIVKARNKTDDLKHSFLIDSASQGQQELPPLSIATRRKQSRISSIAIAIVVVLVLSILGYYGYSVLSIQKESATRATGKITLRHVKASFLDNAESGELLVVSGEALNEFSMPRASLQVKVTVPEPAGQGMISKTAYCGNPLTDEQLESMPLEKIEEAMSNQFGDSLANMEVAPGKAIQFVVVVANLPKEAKDFSIQPVGSTVATGKQ